MIIDVFSKYGWIVPLKDKKGESVTKAFSEIFKEGRKRQYLWVDKGKEFYNKHLKDLLDKNGIHMYSTENEEKSSVVERWNTVLCKSNDSEFRRISCFVLNEISPKFRRTFALETCEISCRLSEISKGLTKFHRIFTQEKCEISFCFGEISESVTKFRRIFALVVREISKGETKISFKMRTKFRKETNLLSKCVRNFVLPERATVSFDVGSVMAALILAFRCRS